MSWEPVRPELVCEVAFDHLQGDRFRHGATFLRWRPDKPRAECTYAQVERGRADRAARALRLTLLLPGRYSWLKARQYDVQGRIDRYVRSGPAEQRGVSTYCAADRQERLPR